MTALCYPESSPAILWTVLGCNIITDAYLLWLPMPMLFQSSLPKATKIVLICLFGCGLFVTVAATLRITLVAVEVHDFHAIGFWSVRETFVAIATTNLPAIFVLLRRWLKPLQSLQSLLRRGGRGERRHGAAGAGTDGTKESGAKHAAIYGSDGTFVGYVSSGRKSHIVGGGDGGGGSDGESPGEESSIKRTTTISSGRKSVTSSQEYILTPLSSRRGPRDGTGSSQGDDSNSSGIGSRLDSLKRSGSSASDLPRIPMGGIRKQVEIMVVAEALQELGAHPGHRDMFEREADRDVERDAGPQPLPGLPGPVHNSW